MAEAAHKIIVMYAGQVVETGAAQDIFRAPRHPYTRALLRALPEFAQDKARLASLPGVVPGKYDRPTGCLLNPRCPYATDRCRAEEPALNQLDDGRQSKCHYHSMMPGGHTMSTHEATLQQPLLRAIDLKNTIR